MKELTDVLVIGIGNQNLFGIDVSLVKEVRTSEEFTSVPSANSPMKVLSLRGTVIPVIDLCEIIQIPQAKENKNLVIIQLENNQLLALHVEHVDKIVREDDFVVKNLENLPEGTKESLSGMIEIKESQKIVGVLDINKILQRNFNE